MPDLAPVVSKKGDRAARRVLPMPLHHGALPGGLRRDPETRPRSPEHNREAFAQAALAACRASPQASRGASARPSPTSPTRGSHRFCRAVGKAVRRERPVAAPLPVIPASTDLAPRQHRACTVGVARDAPQRLRRDRPGIVRDPRRRCAILAALPRASGCSPTRTGGQPLARMRPADEVFDADSLATLRDAPVTVLHPLSLVTGDT